MSDIQNRVVDAVTEKPVIVNVDIKPTTFLQKLLMKWKLMPEKKTYTMHPIVLGNCYRISKEILEIKKTELNKNASIAEASYQLISEHVERVARIVWIGLHNGRKEPDQKDVQFILDNFNAKELRVVFLTIVAQMNLADFINSILLMNGANILEEKTVSVPNASESEGSPIAPGS